MIARLHWLWRLLLDVIEQYRRDRLGDLAANITFWTVLSIPAAVLALVSALGPLESILGASLIDEIRARVNEFVNTTFLDSEPLQETINDLFDADQSGVLTVTSLFALFTLSRGFAAIIRALDDIYRVEEGRPWWHVRLVAMGLGLGTIAVVAGAATLVAMVATRAGSLVALLIAPLILVALTGWASMVFHLGPNHRTPWRFDVPGGVVTALGWTIASQLFALYVRLAPSANQVQSTVGALLLSITLLYVLSVVMLVGAEVNDILTVRAGVARARIPIRSHVDNARQLLTAAITDSEDDDSPDEESRRES